MRPPKQDPEALKRARIQIERDQAAANEIKTSSTRLLTVGLSHLANDESHSSKFRQECEKSKAIDSLASEQLDWIPRLPKLAQLGLLLGEKFMRTKLEF